MRLLLFLAALFTYLLHSARVYQPVAQARQTSYLTKVFCSSDEQARILYEHDMQATRPAFFTQVADSFPSG